jgi:Protein of unknown function (DUF3179)
MSETLVDPKPESSPQDERPISAGKPVTRFFTRGLVLSAILALAVVLTVEVKNLWSEWIILQGEIGGVNNNAVIGYRDISPVVSYAAAPADWFRREGDHSLLWAKWEAGVGHQWFRFDHGDIDRARVVKPKTVLFSRPVDYPVIEVAGGEIWQRVPLDARVVGQTLHGVKCVYPVLILGKVQVVNDMIDDHPFLVVANAFAPPDKAYHIYDASHEGHRLTMAATGYFHDGKPLLFDRGTQSLWVEEKDSMTAIAGQHKKQKLAQVASPTPVTWKAWLSQNTTSRLLVGADRTRGIPIE